MAKAAKDKPAKKPPRQPRPEEIGCEGVMPKKSPPAAEPVDVLSPWAQRSLVWYRDTDRVVMGVCWREKDERDRVTFHLLNTAINGGVEHRVMAASEGRYFTDARVLATAQQFEEYLRGRLLKFGGTRSAYKMLGVEPPAQETVSGSDEAAARLDELYQRAARLLEMPEPDLRKKYGHLNPGLQAMNLRNRLRAKGHNV